MERFIALHQKFRALRVLDRVVDSDMPLFWDDPAIQYNRRLVWLYRIDLLRDWGRYSEALAWTCLECELNPENITAQALKERLKKELHLNVKLQPDADMPSRGQSIKRDEAIPAKEEYARAHFESVNNKLSTLNLADIDSQYRDDAKQYYTFDLHKPNQYQKWMADLKKGKI